MENNILALHANCSDDHAKQNVAPALKQLIEGGINATLFQQIGNLPCSKDGIALFFCLTQLTGISFLQLSM
jgi:hypothetical protein